MHGFKLIEKRFVKEVNADCYYFEHVKSGAHLIKIAANDPNKTFSISFHTIPDSDCGTPHIMEHSVLNGSKNFPVKSPFDIIQKASLKTFVNAFTGKDMTTYPIASMNEKDYFNLMHLYLDAVFYPLIYDDERILKQEGWHYELTDRDAPIVYRGVVHGEMKGAYSAPNRYINFWTYKHLFPDNGYGFESGGYPYAIPSLTYEAFKNFHKKFYHPDNSYIVLYGDANLDKELAFINEKYLANFTRSGNQIMVEDQKPFAAMKDIREYYPVLEGGNTQNQTYLSLSFVYGHNTDLKLSQALSILAYTLFNREAAPVRLALQQAGVGKNINAGVNSYKQNVFTVTVQNANPGDKQKFYDIVMSILKEQSEKGVDKKIVESTLNRNEFQLREGNNAQKGLAYAFQLMPGFVFSKDPFKGLEYEKPLAELKTVLTSNYLEELIKKAFIDNPHSLLLTVEPKPGMDKELNAKVEEELKNYKSTLPEPAIEKLISETKALIAYQMREDTPEALASIPKLTLSDINPKAQFYTATAKKVDGIDVLHREDFTNNIVYTNMYFDLRVLPVDMLPYAALLSEVLTSLSTEKYTFGDLSMEINNSTGGFNTYLTRYFEDDDDAKMIPKFVASVKSTNTKLDKLFEISHEILLKTKLNDPERLKTVLTRLQSRLENQAKSDGAGIANTRFRSYFSNAGMFDEITDGYDFYTFVTTLAKEYDTSSEKIIANLTKAANLLFTKDNLMFGVTCSNDDYKAFTQKAGILTGKLHTVRPNYYTWIFSLEKKNEGIQTASKVQYVYSGYNFKKLGYSWSGKMLVLNKIISRDWLYKQLRVVGGAYGGYSTFSPVGITSFVSYRDPNLKETVDNYRATVEFIKNFNANADDMAQYIIGTVSGIDQPLTASQRGESAFRNYFQKATAAAAQKERDELLGTTSEDIRNFAKMVSDILDQQYICVYGNAEKIGANRELFSNFITIE